MPPKIVVNDPANVTVDGVNAGSLVDVLSNHGKVAGVPGALQAAFADWHGSLVKQHTDALTAAGNLARDQQGAALTKLQADHQAALDARAAEIAKLKADHATILDAARKDHADTITKHRAEVDAMKAHIEALGGTEEAQRLAAVAHRKHLTELRAKIEADLAAMDGTAPSEG